MLSLVGAGERRYDHILAQVSVVIVNVDTIIIILHVTCVSTTSTKQGTKVGHRKCVFWLGVNMSVDFWKQNLSTLTYIDLY